MNEKRSAWRVLAAGLTAVTVAASGILAAGPASAGGGEQAGQRMPVVYDSDMDFDDASTLAYLCEEHKLGRIDLRAVTVADNGFGRPGRALTHARSVLDQCGLPRVPVADGSAGAGVHPAPPELVDTIETVLTGALGDRHLRPPLAPLTAAELIAHAVGSAPKRVTVVATGPLTNLAVALASDRTAARIARIYVMGGALTVPGNLYGSALAGFDNSQEFNVWMDPVSARQVLRRARPGTVHLVPLDATRFVPITRAFIDRLAADHGAPGALLTHRIVSQPDLVALIELDIMYWWDALAVVAAVHDDDAVTSFDEVRIDVVQDGVQSGRTVLTPYGSRVRAAFTADGALFERTFLDALNGRR